MDLQDVQRYIIRNNLNTKSRKREVVDQRAYLFAYLFHFLNIRNLSEIGRMFARLDNHGRPAEKIKVIKGERTTVIDCPDHATVRHHLITSAQIQFHDEFIKNTKELHDQIPIVIPEYKNRARNVGKLPDVKKRGKEYEIKIKITKEVFFDYARKQDPNVIFDYLFKLMLDAAPKLNKARNPQRKSLSSD